MASLTTCLAQLSRVCISASGRTALHRAPPLILAPALQVRHKSAKAPKGQKGLSKVQLAVKAKKLLEKKKKKKPRTTFKTWDMKDAEQFALCDAVRYVIILCRIIDIC
jgi:large subunit ribosomal protein L1